MQKKYQYKSNNKKCRAMQYDFKLDETTLAHYADKDPMIRCSMNTKQSL